MANEKRKHPRLLAEVTVSYRTASPHLLFPEQGEGVVENVSSGGLFLMTSSPLPIGTTVDVEFDVTRSDGQPAKVSARALVRWNRERFEPTGMGLQFTEFFAGEEALEEWLEELAKRL